MIKKRIMAFLMILIGFLAGYYVAVKLRKRQGLVESQSPVSTVYKVEETDNLK